MVDEKDSHEDSSNDEKDCEWIHSKHMDIWNDESSMIQKKNSATISIMFS
jgi:hypothetical protein